MKNNKKGFTLAEMLIVVAIIGVLIAILVPTFTAQLEKAREAADLANIRSAMSELNVQYLSDNSAHEQKVNVTQKTAEWQSGDGKVAGINVTAKTSGEYTVKIDTSGTITVE